MNNIILDIIKESYGKDYIQMSERIYNSVVKLKKFNYENIYSKANDKKTLEFYKNIFNDLFKVYLNAIENKEYENDIYIDFLNSMNEEYKKEKKEQIVIDYLSGMTDNYILRQYKKYINK